MIDKLVSLAISRRLLVGMIALFICAFGYYSWTQLPIEAYPDIAGTSVQVVTQAPGLAAEEVEQQITIPLERELNGTAHLAVMRSKSTFGLSLITLVFSDGTEDYWARQRVLEKMGNVALPEGASPALNPLSSPIGEIYRYTLASKTKTLRELSELQRWKVIPALKRVQGVVDIVNFGGLTTQFTLELDPASLTRFNISLRAVTDAIRANSANAGGSVITRGELGYVVRGIGLVQNLDDLGNIVVTQKDGVPVLLHDLGRLKLGNLERHGVLGKDAKSDAIQGIVLLLRGENPSHVTDALHAEVDKLNADLKLQGVQIAPYLDRSTLVQATIHKVGHTVLEGIALVVFVLMVFLGSPRSALIVAATIPFSVLTAFILMKLTNVPANLLSLGAIDFGIIVNAAIVIVEAAQRLRETRPDGMLTEADAKTAIVAVAKPIFFATTIIITAYIPLFTFQNVEAKLFSPMAYAVTYSLFGALLLSLTLIPGLAYLAYRKPQKVFHNPVVVAIERGYRRMLEGLLDRKWITLGSAAGVLLGAVVLGATVGREYLPELDEGSIWLQIQLPSGISLQKGAEMADTVRKAVREFPEVSYIVTQLGRNDDGTDPFTPSHIESSVGLYPYDTWKSGWNKHDLIAHMNARLAKIPGIRVGFAQPIIDGVNDQVSGAHSQLVIKVFGPSFDTLRDISRQIVGILNHVQGAVDVAIDQEPPLPQFMVNVDRAAIARYGLNVADVANLIRTGLGGAAVTQVYVGERQYDVAVRFPESARNNFDAIGDLVLTASNGAQIPLSDVAKIGVRTGESTITHENSQRQLTVKLNYRNRDLSSLLEEAQGRIQNEVKMDHQSYHIVWAGQFENQQKAEARLGLILMLVMGLMLMLLYVEFAKVRIALLILGVVPLAIFGGLIALHVTGATVNVASGVGFIALFGVAVENGIIMVANLNRMRKADLPLRRAVVEGAVERLRPILMTATVATMGMLPAAMATGVGSDVQRGLGIVIVGGLITTTLLSLFGLPALYFMLEGHRPKKDIPQ